MEKWRVPENEYEKYEQGEKNRHVVHGPQHDDQLPTKSRQETHQLQYSQKSERPQDGQPTSTALTEFHYAARRQHKNAK
ncbi:hypothetical protein CDAR_229831 [Caerostris darwini]|uniref:Uncharacterized protein n=1 Tax=Caerostris darwini TaxID=1538125 RepID=A0AAV4Q100_9ARAC|nr:hypothetical protein CDAR_229831 [Caerostris darwini]